MGEAQYQELGFTYRAVADGSVRISRHGKHVLTLGGLEAARFLNAMRTAEDAEAQVLMARFTGNYKRGNERQ